MFASTRELHYTVHFPYFDISFVAALAAFPVAVLHLARVWVQRGNYRMHSNAKHRHRVFRYSEARLRDA